MLGNIYLSEINDRDSFSKYLQINITNLQYWQDRNFVQQKLWLHPVRYICDSGT